ncbi:hypothetical protein GCM10022243_34500 [Saccharothrix violaceirubra]|uniref:Uncharacterized protein n=1 Tax=Saccharothrix violaceirubra TaxID=413306 RepID=A0A7W7T4Q5_9PSEU|nr:hypothetical protein [Saccharothrix violaceirubra]MBB4966501.1 hypothetical protein [Saccharothrix violaceirubra]
MAVRDIFVGGDGEDSRGGLTWADRVRTFDRARRIAAGVGGPVAFVVGQFVMAREAYFGQRLGKGIEAGYDVPDGWTMRAYDPELPWHFTDLDVLDAPGDFVQVFKDGNTHNANTSIPVGDKEPVPTIADNRGVPTGRPTGVWISTRDVANADKPLFRVVRVWRGGRALTFGDRAAVPSAYDPYNEVWEARSFETLGSDGTHTWTQLTPGEKWGTAPAPASGRLSVFSPHGNPVDQWGGITVLAHRSAGGNGMDLGLLTVRQSSGWRIDESVKVIGGGLAAFKIRGGCADGRIEAKVDVFSPYYPVVDLDPHTGFDTFTGLEISPRWDLRVTHKPYYEIDAAHSTGQSDALRITSGARVAGLLVRGRTTGGTPCYVRDPGHSAVGRPVPAAGVVLDGLVVERDFAVYLGGLQYQRAFVVNGGHDTVRNCVISGRVYGQRTPSQLTGGIKVVGAEFHHGRQMIPAAPDGSFRYPSRFDDRTRDFSHQHPDGKNRDAIALEITMDGKAEVRGCVFDASHGAALNLTKVTGFDATRDGCLVTGCTFVTGTQPGSLPVAVLVDDRGDAGTGVRLRDNVAVGYPASGGAQWTPTGADGKVRTAIRLEDLATGGPRVAENSGWVRQAFATCYR